ILELEPGKSLRAFSAKDGEDVVDDAYLARGQDLPPPGRRNRELSEGDGAEDGRRQGIEGERQPEDALDPSPKRAYARRNGAGGRLVEPGDKYEYGESDEKKCRYSRRGAFHEDHDRTHHDSTLSISSSLSA